MKRILTLTGLTVLLYGCGDEPITIEELAEDAIDVFQGDFFEGEEAYGASTSVEALKVPPELSLPDTSSQMVIPKIEGVSARNTGRGAQAAILPEFLEMKVRREGAARWLEVGATPVALWPHLREFWDQQGYELTTEAPIPGIMETGWRSLSQQVDAVRDGSSARRHFAAIREKFRLRLEREPNGYANLYIARQGMEVAGLDAQNAVVWQASKPDPDREAEMLVRMMEHLGASRLDSMATLDEEEISGTVALEMEYIGGVPVLVVEDDYSSVWRQVGIALERSGLYLIDTDRSAGTYVFRYRGRWAEDKEKGILLETHLLARGEQATLVTAHHHELSGSLSRDLTREVLRHVVAAYTLTARAEPE